MKSILKTLVAGLVVATGIVHFAVAAAQTGSLDAQGLQQLAKAGSDLTKLHHFDFTLRFPSQFAAERAELQLMGFAFVTKTVPGKTGEERVIQASKTMYPVESDLTGLREKLDSIAAAGRGVYEGWRARPLPAK